MPAPKHAAKIIRSKIKKSYRGRKAIMIRGSDEFYERVSELAEKKGVGRSTLCRDIIVAVVMG